MRPGGAGTRRMRGAAQSAPSPLPLPHPRSRPTPTPPSRPAWPCRYLSHFRSVHRGAYFAELRTTTVRKLLPESWGFLCPVHTPDGSPCGLLNHFTAACRILTHGPGRAAEVDVALVEVRPGRLPSPEAHPTHRTPHTCEPVCVSGGQPARGGKANVSELGPGPA